MAKIEDLLDMIDVDDPGSNPLNSLKPFIRFDWESGPGTEWPANRHPAEFAHWSFKLLSGREIRLAEFHQFKLYAGLLAGIPTDTARFASNAIQEAHRLVPGSLPMLVLQPVFREFNHAKFAIETSTKHRVLPPIASAAVFNSNSIGSSPDNPYSSLKVIWFQDTFGLPDDPQTLNQLTAIDWEREAMGWTP